MKRTGRPDSENCTKYNQMQRQHFPGIPHERETRCGNIATRPRGLAGNPSAHTSWNTLTTILELLCDFNPTFTDIRERETLRRYKS